MKINKQRLTTLPFLTAYTAMIAGVLIHAFGLVNVLHNHDSLVTLLNGYGSGVQSGRWFLTVLGDLMVKLFGNFNMPWVNGLVFLALLAVSAGVIASILQFKRKGSAILFGALFVCFPSVTTTMFYRFTVIYYGIAILLAVSAVWFFQRYKHGWLLSILMIALSMGIYQAYICFTIALFVLLLIKRCLTAEEKISKLVVHGLICCGVLLAGFLLYYGAMQLSLKIYAVNLTDYKGIDSMGLSLKELPGMFLYAIKATLLLPLQDYQSLAETGLIRLAYLILALATLGMFAVILVKKTKSLLYTASAALLCILFTIAVSFVVVMCPIDTIYTLMVFPMVLILALPLMLTELLPTFKWLTPVLTKATLLAATVMILCYSYQANVNYTALYYANTQAQNYLSSMLAQIRMTEGFDTDKTWVFIGKTDEPMANTAWNRVERFDGYSPFSSHIRSTKLKRHYFKQYLGVNPPIDDTEKTAELIKATPEFQEMAVWPNQGSIRIIGEYVVIRCE